MSVAELIEIESLKRLKARYFRFMDTKDWAGWRTVFTEDATMRVDGAVSTRGGDGEPVRSAQGVEAILAWVVPRIEPCTTVHHGHMPEIELTSPTTARGVWAMEDIVEYPDQSFRGHGHYHETYRKEGGAWRIATLHLTRLRMERIDR